MQNFFICIASLRQRFHLFQILNFLLHIKDDNCRFCASLSQACSCLYPKKSSHLALQKILLKVWENAENNSLLELSKLAFLFAYTVVLKDFYVIYLYNTLLTIPVHTHPQENIYITSMLKHSNEAIVRLTIIYNLRCITFIIHFL